MLCCIQYRRKWMMTIFWCNVVNPTTKPTIWGWYLLALVGMCNEIWHYIPSYSMLHLGSSPLLMSLWIPPLMFFFQRTLHGEKQIKKNRLETGMERNIHEKITVLWEHHLWFSTWEKVDQTGHFQHFHASSPLLRSLPTWLTSWAPRDFPQTV